MRTGLFYIFVRQPRVLQAWNDFSISTVIHHIALSPMLTDPNN